jgi:hypothetical protein
LQFKHLRRLLGGFIGSKLKRNHYRKTQRTAGRKSSRNKTQTGEEGRRVFSKPFEENSTEEDPIPDRQFCIHSILTVAILHNVLWYNALRIFRQGVSRGGR